ncbi:hypothetical protein Dda_7175 [Drechslerella dactyloides]|uniref:Uncharacterized protein n=1 Tax=Drechslerella dactyloides TaxID=74499 RepID=A0AAD6IWZ7_DREDA|nr:hypothetical protein Dda_7175 [Drechslerella dactyloides]
MLWTSYCPYVMSTALVRHNGVSLFQPGAVDRYLQSHSGSTYQPSSEVSVIKAFQRLAIGQDWTPKQREKQKKNFHAAVDAEFTERVGTGFTLFEWQRLVKIIGIEPIPSSITQCRKAIQKENINIFHILQAYRRATEIDDLDLIQPSKEITRFPSVGKLRAYTRKNKMFYRKENAKGSVLKGLLRVLL